MNKVTNIPGEGISFKAQHLTAVKGGRDGGVGGAEPPKPRALGYDLDDLNREFAFVLVGSKAVIIQEDPQASFQDRVRLMTLDAFKAWFMNAKTEIAGDDGAIKRITWATAWLTNRDRRQFKGIEFHPDPEMKGGASGYFNYWRGFDVTPRAKKNGYAIFRDHLFNNVCKGQDDLFQWVFGWFAHMMQRPRERVGTALVFQGEFGAGKTKIGEVIGSLMRSHYFLVDDPRYLIGQFNAHMGSCLLLQADEAVWAGNKHAEGRLKGLITSEIQMIEAKGIDAIRVKNYVRLIMTSNEDWVVPTGKGERRYCVLRVDPRCAVNVDYFREMEAELDNGGREALLHDLLTFDLSKVQLRHVPKTSELMTQKVHSFDPIDAWWFDRLRSAQTTRAVNDWLSVVPTKALADDYRAVSDEVGVRRKSYETELGMRMKKLVPGVERRQKSLMFGGQQRTKEWCYLMPTLAECRSAFEQAVGQTIDWGDDGDEDHHHHHPLDDSS